MPKSTKPARNPKPPKPAVTPEWPPPKPWEHQHEIERASLAGLDMVAPMVMRTIEAMTGGENPVLRTIADVMFREVKGARDIAVIIDGRRFARLTFTGDLPIIGDGI